MRIPVRKINNKVTGEEVEVEVEEKGRERDAEIQFCAGGSKDKCRQERNKGVSVGRWYEVGGQQGMPRE
jgi:hypothetical protein